MLKKLICLANSYKETNRCVAGIENLEDGSWKWVRPVSDTVDGSLAMEQICYGNVHKKVEPLDIFELNVKEYITRHGFQAENRIIDSTDAWKYIERFNPAKLEQFLYLGFDGLWFSSHEVHKNHDRIPVERLGKIRDSLRLVKVPELLIYYKTYFEGRVKMRGSFSLYGETYDLSITDPYIKGIRLYNREWPIKEPMLCISLGVLFQGHAYRLIATVLTSEGKPKSENLT